MFCPGLLSHSCGLSPSGTALEFDILLIATPKGVLMKRALKMLLGALVPGIREKKFFYVLLVDHDTPGLRDLSLVRFVDCGIHSSQDSSI
jgi:hypothetical protein